MKSNEQQQSAREVAQPRFNYMGKEVAADAMTITEKMQSITPAEFGVRIANGGPGLRHTLRGYYATPHDFWIATTGFGKHQELRDDYADIVVIAWQEIAPDPAPYQPKTAKEER